MSGERTRRVYRVTATYDRQPFGGYLRHYLSKSGAEQRADLLREGREAEHDSEGNTVVSELPPASTVTVEPSEPVTWPHLGEQP